MLLAVGARGNIADGIDLVHADHVPHGEAAGWVLLADLLHARIARLRERLPGRAVAVAAVALEPVRDDPGRTDVGVHRVGDAGAVPAHVTTVRVEGAGRGHAVVVVTRIAAREVERCARDASRVRAAARDRRVADVAGRGFTG